MCILFMENLFWTTHVTFDKHSTEKQMKQKVTQKQETLPFQTFHLWLDLYAGWHFGLFNLSALYAYLCLLACLFVFGLSTTDKNKICLLCRFTILAFLKEEDKCSLHHGGAQGNEIWCSFFQFAVSVSSLRAAASIRMGPGQGMSNCMLEYARVCQGMPNQIELVWQLRKRCVWYVWGVKQKKQSFLKLGQSISKRRTPLKNPMKWNWLSKGLTIKAKDLPSGSVGGILLPNCPLYRLLRCFSSSPAVAIFTCQAKCTDWCPSKRTQEALPHALPSLLGWTQAYTAQSYCQWCTLLLAAVKTVQLSSLTAKTYITSNLLNWNDTQGFMSWQIQNICMITILFIWIITCVIENIFWYCQ